MQRYRHTTLVALFLVMLWASSARSADTYTISYDADTTGVVSEYVGQSFTTTKGGTLTTIELAAAATSAGVTFTIHEGNGNTGALIYTQTGITITDGGGGWSPPIALTTPPTLTANTQYTFLFTGPFITLRYNTAGAYAGGHTWAGIVGTLLAHAPWDLKFRLTILTPPEDDSDDSDDSDDTATASTIGFVAALKNRVEAHMEALTEEEE
jgi:hypothetical protein